jgi:hypothetical protein
MKKLFTVTFLTISMLIITACGGVATPAPNSATLEAEASAQSAGETRTDVEVVIVPTDTPVPPSSTPVPPTIAPTEIPPTATLEPTVEPTTEEIPEEYRDIVLRVSRFGRPENGEQLFTTVYTTKRGDFSCSICNRVYSEDRGIGPGHYYLHNRAPNRVEGMPAEVYVVNSIRHPSDYVVEDFPDELMPGNYSEIFSDQEIFDLAAYLLTLGDE